MTAPILMASPPQATGLTTLAGDAFGGGPTTLIVPGTWEPSADSGERGDDS